MTMSLTIQDALLLVLNISLMFSVGLELELGRFAQDMRRWRLFLAVAAFNFGALPLLALLLTRSMAMSSAVASGLLLAALCPGGGTGVLFTRFAKGSLELSTALLGVLTFISIPLTPTLLPRFIAESSGGGMPLWPILRTLGAFQVLPLVVGGLVRAHSTAWAIRANRYARPLSNIAFVALAGGLLITHGHAALSIGWRGLLAMATVVVVSGLLPFFLPVVRSERAALSLTTTVRNLSLALLLSMTFFETTTTIAVLAYGVVMYVLGTAWIAGLRWGSLHFATPVRTNACPPAAPASPTET